MELNKIYHGDCLELMKQIPDGLVDMILCDLPYNLTQNKWDSEINMIELFEIYWRIIKPDGVIILTSQQPFTSKLILSQFKYYKYSWIWVKNKASGFLNAKKQPLRAFEEICVFYKKQPTFKAIPYKDEEYEYRSLNV